MMRLRNVGRSKGEADAPWGAPISLGFHAPSSITPALTHLSMRRRTRLSAMRCSRNFRSSHDRDW